MTHGVDADGTGLYFHVWLRVNNFCEQGISTRRSATAEVARDA